MRIIISEKLFFNQRSDLACCVVKSNRYAFRPNWICSFSFYGINEWSFIFPFSIKAKEFKPTRKYFHAELVCGYLSSSIWCNTAKLITLPFFFPVVDQTQDFQKYYYRSRIACWPYQRISLRQMPPRYHSQFGDWPSHMPFGIFWNEKPNWQFAQKICLGFKYCLECQLLACLLSSCETQHSTSSDKNGEWIRQIFLVTK